MSRSSFATLLDCYTRQIMSRPPGRAEAAGSFWQVYPANIRQTENTCSIWRNIPPAATLASLSGALRADCFALRPDLAAQGPFSDLHGESSGPPPRRFAGLQTHDRTA